MTEHGTFYRKVTYLALIAVLLFPLSHLGAPKTRQDESGGKLAELRDEYNLGHSNLGEIDPTSEAMRMATLGARGIAVSWLWTKANKYKKKEDWTNFRATLTQLAKLQPYFISFWRFQSWNLTYNVSVELDNVRDRFYYVKRGIEFLKEGTAYNRDSPYLLSELGWFIGNKIGKADERLQYRKMFKKDDDFHDKFFDGDPPRRENRDNWLVAGLQYVEAVSAVDDRKKSLGQKNPTTFYASPGMAQINYGEAIETEGIFGEKARMAWKKAAALWRSYGNRELKSSRGFYIRLAGLDRLEAESLSLEQELKTLAPGLREQLKREREAALTDEDRELLMQKSSAELSSELRDGLHEVQLRLNISWQDLADRIARDSPNQSAQARKIASRLQKLKSRVMLTRTNRDVSNYAYWENRCEFEQTPNALKARELAYEGWLAFRKKADLIGAQRLYEESFVLWAKVLADYPQLIDDTTTGADIMDYINQYTTILTQLDKSLTDEAVDASFPLWEMLELNDTEQNHKEAIAVHHRRKTEKKEAAAGDEPGK
ncbi:MAG: hypothetical protein MK171_09040 [Pirellulales bacterium]|nr:hypothetical protein [Pirellulales bacterium]